MTPQTPDAGAGQQAPQPARPRTRVLIATGSARLRQRIDAALTATGTAELLTGVSDGHSLVALCLSLRPDVIVMDSMLTAMSGAEAAAYLMEHVPTPVLVIATARNGDNSGARDCLAAGAVDVLAAPAAAETGTPDWDHALVAAVSVVARIKVIPQLRSGRRPGTAAPRSAAASGGLFADSPARPARPTQSPQPPGPRASTLTPGTPPSGTRPSGRHSLIAIGASTGGPSAIVTVLSRVSRPCSLPLLVVLHMNEEFNPSITRWLRETTGHRVRQAVSGEPVAATAGEVVIAPPGRHLVVSGGLLILTDAPKVHSCRPSVDVLFDSIAADFGPRAAACLLTGMGKDGATGMLAIHTAGGLTIAQDEATSVVYGMPAEAARLGAAQRILPIDQIGPALEAVATTIVSVR